MIPRKQPADLWRLMSLTCGRLYRNWGKPSYPPAVSEWELHDNVSPHFFQYPGGQLIRKLVDLFFRPAFNIPAWHRHGFLLSFGMARTPTVKGYDLLNKLFLTIAGALVVLGMSLAAIAGCGDDTTRTATATTSTGAGEMTTTVSAGIVLDPKLTSKTGVPKPEDMPVLIAMQGEIPYPVIVPTQLPTAGYILQSDLIGTGKPTVKDPAGYYSYRYSDPANPDTTLTFNQSRSNSTPLAGYYLTNVNINNIPYQVYWHRSRDYLPIGDPVPAETVGNAEAFVIVWKGQYTDANGVPQELFYSLTTGTWGYSWEEVQSILQGLRPLGDVGK